MHVPNRAVCAGCLWHELQPRHYEVPESALHTCRVVENAQKTRQRQQGAKHAMHRVHSVCQDQFQGSGVLGGASVRT